MKWRNQLLAISCLLVFFAVGVLYFENWVVQKPFGIILFIGEGLTPSELSAARVYAAGADTPLAIDSLSNAALLKNYSSDSATPDQAAAATALATGVKGKNGVIGVDSEGKALANLMERARQSGRMTGLITNGVLTDPTVASFYGHSNSTKDRQDLAHQLVANAKIDVILGGGASDFIPEAAGGRRTDNRDLLVEAQKAGYDVVQSVAELDAVPRWRRAKLLGLFSQSELAHADDEVLHAEQPSLAGMVRRAIELLQFNGGGYLLVVDAGLMRKPAQENNTERLLRETIELDRAVSMALQYAGLKSAIFVCGDVGIGGLTISGFPGRAKTGADFLQLNTEAAYQLAWATGPAAVKPFDSKQAERPIETGGPEGTPGESVQPANEPTAGATDTAQNTLGDVAAYGTGLGADALKGTLENTALFDIILSNF